MRTDTVKSLTENPDSGKLPFIVAIIKKSMNSMCPSWDITLDAVAEIAMTANNPGKLLHALDVIDPIDGELITVETVHDRMLNRFAYASDIEWGKMWDEFKDKDQRRVFKIGSTI